MYLTPRYIALTALRAQSGALKPAPRRFVSKSSAETSRRWSPFLLAGATGGLTLVAGGYAWYHFSTVKRVVDASKRAKVYVQDTVKEVRTAVSEARGDESLKRASIWLNSKKAARGRKDAASTKSEKGSDD